MNERIKELYNQCFVELKNDVPNIGFDFEKFAELIVRECADKLESTDIVHGYVAKFLSNEIKEHFGVEE